MGLFGSYFLKLFFKTVFENLKNIILVLSKNRSYSLNLVFFCVFHVFQNKKVENQACFLCFSCFCF